MNPLNYSIQPLEVKENFDPLKSCRVCLSKDVTMTHIFDNENKLLDRIEFCTGLLMKKEEGLPTHICHNCLNNLTIAHEFKTSCLVAEQIFQKTVKNRVKIEISIEDVNDDCNPDNDYNDGVKDETDLQSFEANVKVEKNVQKSGRKKAKHKEDSKLKESSQENQRRPYKKRNPYVVRGPYKKRVVKTRTETKPANQPIANTTTKINGKRNYVLKNFFCRACRNRFTSKQDYLEHKKVHENDNVKYMCEFCGKEFTRSSNFNAHVRLHLSPHFECAHCDYSCNSKGNLAMHLRIHFGIKKFICEKCNAKFTSPSNLRRHELRHRGEKRFGCSLCDKFFYEKAQLVNHIDFHNQIKRYSCDQCHTRFRRRCHWKKHMAKQHSIIIPQVRPGRKKTVAVLENHSES